MLSFKIIYRITFELDQTKVATSGKSFQRRQKFTGLRSKTKRVMWVFIGQGRIRGAAGFGLWADF